MPSTMHTTKTTEPKIESGEYMVLRGYHPASAQERAQFGGFVTRESLPKLISGLIKRSLYRMTGPNVAEPITVYPGVMRPTHYTWQPEVELMEEFAGDPGSDFEVRSINVNGREIGTLRYFGVPDLVDDLLLDSKS